MKESKQIELNEMLNALDDLFHDTIYWYNPNGADSYECRLCYASSDYIRGEEQPIQHYPDCPGLIAQKLLKEGLE